MKTLNLQGFNNKKNKWTTKIFIDEDKAQQVINLHICILIFITLEIFYK